MKKTVVVSVILLMALVNGSWSRKVQKSIPKLKEIASFQYCAIEATGSWSTYNDAVLKLEKEIKEQQIPVKGTVISIWRSYPAKTKEKDYKWEVGYKVTGNIPLKKPLVLKEWKTKKLYSQSYNGPSEGVTSFFRNYWSWFEDNGLEVVRPLLEIGAPKNEIGKGESKFEALVFAVKKE